MLALLGIDPQTPLASYDNESRTASDADVAPEDKETPAAQQVPMPDKSRTFDNINVTYDDVEGQGKFSVAYDITVSSRHGSFDITCRPKDEGQPLGLVFSFTNEGVLTKHSAGKLMDPDSPFAKLAEEVTPHKFVGEMSMVPPEKAKPLLVYIFRSLMEYYLAHLPAEPQEE